MLAYPSISPVRPVFSNRNQLIRYTTTSVAILGAGHGGLALAGRLAQDGHQVTLWNRTPSRIAPVAKLGGVQLHSCSRIRENSVDESVRVPISLATSSLKAALDQSSLVLVSVPASAHADLARACAPHLRDGQTVLLLPGRTGGALEFRQVLWHQGCRARILLGEANTFPVAARCVGPAEAVIYGGKSEVLASALPSWRTPELLAACRPVLPMLTAADSVLHTGLDNLGAILHPAITSLNAERIQRGDSFDFYHEGVTPEVAAVLEAADAERLQIAAAYGVPACSLRAWIAAAYGHHAGNILDAVRGNPAYAGIRAPATIQHRYLLEDVPTGLIPLIELGRTAGLALPVLRGLVHQAGLALGDNRWLNRRSLQVLGLAGLGAREIRMVIERGHVPPHEPILRIGIRRSRRFRLPMRSLSA
ncbi:MAG TPA: NAD/NADP octopine/nopaline dehydrogenase family protein [Gemmataceae bacterium]|nr:NAD/NADP octopine/nopaline dehydrogenase family protein [Gemmataceae bacterium]